MSVCLITGGAGFIGSHLADRLLELGHRVVVIDDLSSGTLENVRNAGYSSQFEFIEQNAGNEALLRDVVPDVDLIFHLAATVGVFNIIDSPAATIENNITTTSVVLDVAADEGKKVILASTSEVYGKSTVSPFHEDGDIVLGPTSKFRWSYAASKLIDEFLALAFWKERGVPTVVARLFNTIGPRQVGRYGMVVPRFLSQALRGENLSVYGTGRQSRCFTYVGDVVEWLILLAENDDAVGRIFNLGNPHEVTILELAEMVLDVTGAQVGVDCVSYEEAYGPDFEDMQRRVPDITAVTSLTGRRPQVPLREALQRTLDWMIMRQSRTSEVAMRSEPDTVVEKDLG